MSAALEGKRRSLQFILAGLLVLLCSSPASALSIVVIGDSHTGPLGPPLVRILEAAGHSVQVVHHSGWSTRSYLQRRNGFPRLHSPDLAIVILGGNNRVWSYSDYSRMLNRMIDRLESAGARHVIWVAPFPADSPRVSRRHLLTLALQRSMLSSRSDVTWVDPASAVSVSTVDGIHYSRAFYREFSRHLYNRVIRPCLSTCP